MCGILGTIGWDTISSNDVVDSLRRLDYRGYDSFGIATDSGLYEKHAGHITGVRENACRIAISHTRWATHGKATEANAHPHRDCSGNIFVVHNGIIENYQEIKENLQALGHDFCSETDSEIIPHYFEEGLKMGQSIEHTVDNFFAEAKGTFAVAMLVSGVDKLYAFKMSSPLAIGAGNRRFFVASDPYAFSDKAPEALFLEDGEFAVITRYKYSVFRDGMEISRQPKKLGMQKSSGKEGHEHFMIKEILEEGEAAGRLLESLENAQKQGMQSLVDMIKRSRKVIFIASGSSYHSTLLGVYFLKKAGVESQTLIASEFHDYASIDNETVVIAVSQSGETMDVIEAVKHSREKGAKIVSIVNSRYSTIERMSDLALGIEAGQEICVAATKTFVNQAVLFLAIANQMGYQAELDKISGEIRQMLGNQEIKNIAKSLAGNRDIYIIGRGLAYPVAREIALKLKEIAYVHAEGMMGGELKHGTLALIEEKTPVISLIDGNGSIVSNTKEAEARGARIIALTSRKERLFAEEIRIDAGSDSSFAILAAIAGQLLSYYIAKEKKLPIDKPRNLAKSVTVL